MDRSEVPSFVGRLRMTSRKLPVNNAPADPIAVTILGENDFFKGDGGFAPIPEGNLVPIESLTCDSPVRADILRVEFWELSETRVFVKIHSNWN